MGSGSSEPRARRVGPCPRGGGLTDALGLGLHPPPPAGSTSPEPSPRKKSPLCTCCWHRSLDSAGLRQAGAQEGRPGCCPAPPKHRHTLLLSPRGDPDVRRLSLRPKGVTEGSGLPRGKGSGAQGGRRWTAQTRRHAQPPSCPRPPQRPKAQRPTAAPLGRDRSWKPSRLHYER